MKHNPFKGMGIALITPFKKDLSVDTESLVKIVNHVIDKGADLCYNNVYLKKYCR